MTGRLQIIGVVGDALDDGLDKPVVPALYLPFTVSTFMGTQVLVQTSGEPLSMLHDIRREIAAINPGSTNRFRRAGISRGGSGANPSLRFRVSSPFFSERSPALPWFWPEWAWHASCLTKGSSVRQRFGIRMALGAQRADVLRIVMWSAVASVGIGLAAGMRTKLRTGWVHHALGA